ncbi:MAG: hypothetical protein ACPGSL_06820 [Vicingaceae bacterium]
MNKRIYILLITIMLTSSMFGQFIGRDHLSVAIFYLQKTELDSAKKYIDLAVLDQTLDTTAKTWFYKGYIYKDLYKLKEKNITTSTLRDTSVQAFKKMLTLNGKEEFIDKTNKVLKYLASTYYNDGVRMLNFTEYKGAITNYASFKELMLLIDPNSNLSQYDVRFKMALATILGQPVGVLAKQDSILKLEVKRLYQEVLAIDSENAAANYNLGIIYYNEGVEAIHKMDYDIDLVSLNKIQDFCSETFLASLPFMMKSYELNYKRKETLVGLSSIYYGLNDKEKSDFYKKELENLEKE